MKDLFNTSDFKETTKIVLSLFISFLLLDMLSIDHSNKILFLKFFLVNIISYVLIFSSIVFFVKKNITSVWIWLIILISIIGLFNYFAYLIEPKIYYYRLIYVIKDIAFYGILFISWISLNYLSKNRLLIFILGYSVTIMIFYFVTLPEIYNNYKHDKSLTYFFISFFITELFHIIFWSVILFCTFKILKISNKIIKNGN